MMVWIVKFRLSKKLKIGNYKSERLWKLDNGSIFGKDFFAGKGEK